MSDTNKKVVPFGNPEIPMEKKAELVQAWLSLGNMRKACELTGMKYETAMHWKKEKPWWPKLVEEIKKEQRTELQSKLNGITTVALEIMEDRLRSGEYILNNKTGEIVRKPVSLRDANMAARDLMTQSVKLDEMNEKNNQLDVSTTEVLKQLAGEFAKFAAKKKPVEVVDVEAKEIQE